MKKLFVLLSLLSVFFLSCGSDDSIDLSIKDPSFIAREYTGVCKISITGEINRDEVENVTRALIGRTTNGNELKLENTTEFSNIVGSGKGILSQFRYTDESKSIATFKSGGIDIKGWSGEQVPKYINEWFKDIYSEIQEVNIILGEENKANKYIIEDGYLKLVYKGTLSIKAKLANGNSISKDYPIQYIYSLTKISTI